MSGSVTTAWWCASRRWRALAVFWRKTCLEMLRCCRYVCFVLQEAFSYEQGTPANLLIFKVNSSYECPFLQLRLSVCAVATAPLSKYTLYTWGYTTLGRWSFDISLCCVPPRADVMIKENQPAKKPWGYHAVTTAHLCSYDCPFVQLRLPVCADRLNIMYRKVFKVP
jgi:hypothetical protein